MFWHMPAGLCLYFIASSMWGIAERMLLGKTSTSTAVVTEPSVTVREVETTSNGSKKNGSAARNGGPASAPAAEKKPGFFRKLMEAAEQAQKQAEKTKEKQPRGRKKKDR